MVASSERYRPLSPECGRVFERLSVIDIYNDAVFSPINNYNSNYPTH